MSRIKSSLRTAVPVVLAMLVGAAMVGVAQSHPGDKALLHSGHSDTMKGTLKARNFKYLKAKTFRYIVSGGAFIPENAGQTVDHGNYSGMVSLNGGPAVTGLDLPPGAVVTRFELFTADGAGAVDIHLESNDLQGNHGDVVDMTAASTCGSTTFCKETATGLDDPATPQRENVIAKNRHYGLWANGPGTIYKVLIFYKTRAPLPPVGTGIAVSGTGGDTNP